jgi:hypothetical protein
MVGLATALPGATAAMVDIKISLPVISPGS